MKNDIERLLEGKEAVIFDVDGTLIDSMGVWEEVDRIYLTRHGKPMSEDLQRKLALMIRLKKCWWNGMNWLLSSIDMKFR